MRDGESGPFGQMLYFVACPPGETAAIIMTKGGGDMIGENIRSARKAKGISQEELAVQLHVVRQTVSKWERGLSVPDGDILVQMAQLLEVPVSQLLGSELPDQTVPDLTAELTRLNEVLAIKNQAEALREQANRKRGLILFLSFAALVVAMGVGNEVVSIVLTGSCALAALIILYRNLALLTSLTTQDRKLGALRITTIFDIAVLLLMVGIIALDRAALIQLSQKGETLLAVAVMSVVMLFVGLIAPKLPFNRHTGLRLPWTVQDEDTWNVAHRVLGLISLPMVLLYLAAAWTVRRVEVVSVVTMLLWVGIPGVISYLFFWKKLHGKL